MNTLLKIQIRVIGKELEQIAAATKGVKSLSAASSGVSGVGASTKAVTKAAKAAAPAIKAMEKSGAGIAKQVGAPTAANPFGLSNQKLKAMADNLRDIQSAAKKARKEAEATAAATAQAKAGNAALQTTTGRPIKNFADYSKTSQAQIAAQKKASDQAMALAAQANTAQMRWGEQRTAQIDKQLGREVEAQRKANAQQMAMGAQRAAQIDKELEREAEKARKNAQKVAAEKIRLDQSTGAALERTAEKLEKLETTSMKNKMKWDKQAFDAQVKVATEAMNEVEAKINNLGKKGKAAATAAASGVGGAGKGVATAVGAAASGSGGGGFLNRLDQSQMVQAGKNVQWIGRQLEFNFTLPIMAAGTAATKWALDLERAMTRVRKVYDQGVLDKPAFETMMGKLQQGVMLLSETFGESASDVADIMGLWAAAGYQEGALAEMTKKTLEAMAIGDFDSTEEAFESLIQVQSAYGLSANQVTSAMASINAVDNATAANFADITRVVAKAGSTANTAGVSLSYLAAMAAQLVPATADAAEAGTGLRSLITRFQAPDNKTMESWKGLGLDVEEMLNLPFDQKLEKWAWAIEALPDSAKTLAMRDAAGLWQINKIDVLQKGIIDRDSAFHTATDVQADSTKNLAQYNEELGILLDSNPKQFDMLIQSIRNSFIKAIVPMIPMIMSVVRSIGDLASAFANLDPGTKKWVMFGLLAVAAIGPIMRVIGAFTMLGGTLGALIPKFGKVDAAGARTGGNLAGKLVTGIRSAIGAIGDLIKKILTEMIPAMARGIAAAARFAWSLLTRVAVAVWNTIVAMTAQLVSLATTAAGYIATGAAAVGSAIAAAAAWLLPLLPIIAIGAAIIGLLAVIYYFRDEIWDALKWVGDKIGKLPGIFGRALAALFKVVMSAVQAISDALSYLNPFARHSPSLVEQVNRGVDIIAKKYASLRGLSSIFRRAADDFQAFDAATSGASATGKATERAAQKEVILEYAPEAGPSVDAMYESIDALDGQLKIIAEEITKQQVLVDAATDAYEDWDRQVTAATAHLDQLKAAADELKTQLDAANEKLSEYANAPIQGMRAMDDAIFANEIAQKRLNLEMMRMEDAIGPIDDIKDKMAGLQGDIEKLRGLQADLRSAGAGSEILGPIDDQVNALQAQQESFEAQLAPIEAMRTELELLERQAERMDLERALAFDPLTRQIEQFADTSKELPFDEILAGITEQRAKVDELTPAWEAANAKVEAQQAIVDKLTLSRDVAKAAMDVEVEALQQLNDAYSATEAQMQALQSALDDFVSKMQSAAAAAKEAEEAYALTEDFETPEVAAGDEPPFDIDAWLKANTPEQEDMFEWIKNIGKWPGWAWDGIKEGFGKLGGQVKSGWLEVWGHFASGVDKIWEWLKSKWSAFTGWLTDVAIKPIKDFFHMLNPMARHSPSAVDNVQEGLQQIIDFFTEFPGRILSAIGDVGAWLWSQLVVGWEFLRTSIDEKKQAMIDTFVGIGGKIWDKIGDIGSWLWGKVSGGFETLKTNISKVVEDVVGFFTGLPDKLAGAASSVWTTAVSIGSNIISGIKSGLDSLTGIVTDIASILKNKFASIWNGVVDKMQGGVNAAIDLANRLNPFTDIGKQDFSTWKLSTYHKGGYVEGPSGADVPIMAQAGEFVLSLTHLKALKQATGVVASRGESNTTLVNNGGGDTTLVFNGDLSFPNITDGGDAQKLVRNLESLSSR